jgi:membrane-associated phospholipid phosphatase
VSITGGLKAAAHGGISCWARRLCSNIAWGAATIVRAPRAEAPPVRRAYVRLAAGALVAGCAILAVMVLADGWVAETMKRSPRWLIVLFDQLTDFGKSGWFLWPTGILLLAVAALASPALRFIDRLTLAAVGLRLAFLFTAVAVPSLVVTIVKRIIGRARPYVGEYADPFLYLQPVWRSDYASMPSGHATTAFAVAVAIGLIWPRLRALMLAYALVIAVSRVVLDAHYVSDVMAGAIVGAVGALLVRDWFAARRLGFTVRADGRVEARPGPSLERIKRVARRLFAP